MNHSQNFRRISKVFFKQSTFSHNRFLTQTYCHSISYGRRTNSNLLTWTEAEKEVFSKEQIEICEMKVRGDFNSVIMEKFHLKSLSNITTAVVSTINGNSWRPLVGVGGRNCLLSEVDTKIFKDEIKKRSYDLNCLSTKEGLSLIYELREQRYLKGIRIANICSQRSTLSKSYIEVIQKLNPISPSDSWFYSFCQNNSIFLKNKEKLEKARQECCNQTNVRNFFTKFQHLLLNKHKR